MASKLRRARSITRAAPNSRSDACICGFGFAISIATHSGEKAPVKPVLIKRYQLVHPVCFRRKRREADASLRL